MRGEEDIFSIFINMEGIKHPGLWQHYVQRKDNIGLPIMKVKRKYLAEQLQFDSLDSFQSPFNSNSSSGVGGPTSIYPKFIKVEFIENGVSQGVSTYVKALDISSRSVFKALQTIVAYSNVLGVDCDYTSIYYERNITQRPILSGWFAREIPCGAKADVVVGPTTTLPYGTYGQIVGPGKGYIVT